MIMKPPCLPVGRQARFPPLQGAFWQSQNRSQGAVLAPRNPLFSPRSPSPCLRATHRQAKERGVGFVAARVLH